MGVEIVERKMSVHDVCLNVYSVMFANTITTHNTRIHRIHSNVHCI